MSVECGLDEWFIDHIFLAHFAKLLMDWVITEIKSKNLYIPSLYNQEPNNVIIFECILSVTFNTINYEISF